MLVVSLAQHWSTCPKAPHEPTLEERHSLLRLIRKKRQEKGEIYALWLNHNFAWKVYHTVLPMTAPAVAEVSWHWRQEICWGYWTIWLWETTPK